MPEKTQWFDLSQETKNGIWVVLSFTAAVLSVLAFLHKAGTAGDIFSSFSKTLFGWGFFVIPIAFALLGSAFLRSFSKKASVGALFGTALMVLGFLGVLFVIRDVDTQVRLVQGGYLGTIFGFPLLKLTGFTASLVVLLAVIFVSFLVALDIPFHSLIFRKKEEGGTDEESKLSGELNEKLIIKQGSQVVGSKPMFEAKSIQQDKKVVSASVRTKDDEENEFSIRTALNREWKLPPLEFLHADSDSPKAGDIAANASIIKRTLANFSIDVEMGEVNVGPTVTQYTLRPAVGVKIAKITTLQNDLSLALAAHPLRIEAPIPGKSLVGVEVPNKKSALVGLRNIIESEEFQKSPHFLALGVGRDVAGYPLVAGLERMPHLLIAGATGTGKSVSINTVLLSLLYRHSPDILKLIMIDPKRVELSLYNGIPHLITPVIVDSKKAINALRWAVKEMERRYELLSGIGSRDIFSYNTKQAAAKKSLIPFVVIVIDELADIMAAYGRDVEGAIVRLAQMARAVGIHLIVSTQRPSVEVITGLIKANITSRIAFQVASQVDSRTILDNAGAEKLLGNGDMLYQAGDVSKPKRVQGGYVSEKEVKDVVRFLKDQDYEATLTAAPVGEDITQPHSNISDFTDSHDDDYQGGDDPLFEDAKEVVLQAKKASSSLLQRRLRVGYARAARLIDMLEEAGIVGPGEGAKPREILVGTPISMVSTGEPIAVEEEESQDNLI